tara:strand:+ start:829 stop:1044 length:216 start_codon:yes stop_codon:yes gene_type:complete
MNLKAKYFVEAIRTASEPIEVLNLWSQAARNTEFSLKDIQDMHKACGAILLEAIQNNYEKKEATSEEKTEE